ncbi:MAG: hypothetical protein QME94_04910 [Anaerolineae bacterium]|nr:hypothetical protein [Anaerolineae bacterium]
MRGTLRLGLALVVLCVSAAGRARAAPTGADNRPDRLASLIISIWLEYDRPGVLFIYRGELTAGAPLPARLTFRLPVEPSSTACIDGEEELHYARPELARDGSDVIVTYETRWPRFQLEYYQDALERRGPARRLDFVYRAECAIEHLVVEVKEPFAAADLALVPPASMQSQADDGLMEHRRIVGPVAPGDEVRWEITYTKHDPQLVSEALGLPTPGVVSYEDAGVPVTPWVEAGERATWALLGLVGLAGAAAVGLGLHSSMRRASEAGADRHTEAEQSRPRGRGSRFPEPPHVRPARYCHQCGASFARGALFCRRCGARRRGALQAAGGRRGRN